ncbi:MAG: D-glycerate dehydrogenase, partial [Chloroflexi bacterium]|nr:D-glycerate dehydrogenase [Chloroflexota bacterium]
MDRRPSVFITRLIPQQAIDHVAEVADVEVWPGEMPPTRAELAERLAKADGVLALLTDPIDDALRAGAPRLRVIANMAVGYDNVEIAAATRRGVLLTNTPGVLT